LIARDRELEEVVKRVAADGIVAEDGIVAAPVYVRGTVNGVIALNTDDGAKQTDTLSAISTLASAAVESAREIETLHVQKALWQESAATGIVGSSAVLKRVLQMAERVAPQDTTVLILGESGTGKELIARTVHQKSRRSDQPFVAINCAALTETLLESELFGHEKGAFTGAAAQKKGKLEMAEGGTVFLDEIGEMTAPLQAKMLRVLQQREFERVGGTRTLRLDVRLIAATNRDLTGEVRAGRFREDLFHRLNVVALMTPPLRDRKEDILALAMHFLARSSARCGRKVGGISSEAQHCLTAYSWPGNVRELENAIERAVVLGDADTVQPEDLPETVLETPALSPELAGGYQATVGDAKRDAILQAWAEARGDYKLAARALGLHPNSLLRLVRNLGLRVELERAAKS
jgi:two-component system, NtrC family, response regulator HydG